MALLDPACHIHPSIPLAQRHKDRCLIESRGSALGVALFARPFKELLVEDRRARHGHAFIHASDDASVPMELITHINESNRSPVSGFLCPTLDGLSRPDAASRDRDLGWREGLIALNELVRALSSDPDQVSDAVDVEEVVHRLRS